MTDESVPFLVFVAVASDDVDDDAVILSASLIATIPTQNFKIVDWISLAIDNKPRPGHEVGAEKGGYDSQKWIRRSMSPRGACQAIAQWLGPYRTLRRTSQQGKEYSVALCAGYNLERFHMRLLSKMFREQEIFLPMTMNGLDVMDLARWREITGDLPAKTQSMNGILSFFGLDPRGVGSYESARAAVRIAAALNGVVKLGSGRQPGSEPTTTSPVATEMV